jgi:hypothetical protein
MSSGRRAGSEQSILEMLERDTGRGNRRGNRSRLAWYGAGSALAVGLIGLLAWLAHDSAPPQEAQPMVVAEVAGSAERSSKPDPVDELMGLNEPDDPPRPHHAAVIDEQAVHAAKPLTPVGLLRTSSQPPLAAPGAGSGAVVQDDPTASAMVKATDAASHEAPKNRPAHTAAPARQRVPARPTASSAHSSPRKTAHNTPRARKTAQPAAPGHSTVDSDVALISAVIQHSSARDAACADAACAAKTTAQP